MIGCYLDLIKVTDLYITKIDIAITNNFCNISGLLYNTYSRCLSFAAAVAEPFPMTRTITNTVGTVATATQCAAMLFAPLDSIKTNHNQGGTQGF